jgi:hypothetical protein
LLCDNLRRINIFEKTTIMKRIFFTIGIMGLIAAGCNNSDTAGKDKKTTGDSAAATDSIPASITDLGTTKDTMALLAQNWESKEDALDAELSGGSTNLDMPYHGMSLFPDHSMVSNPRDNIAFGKWELIGKNLVPTFSDGSKKELQVLMLDAKTLILGSRESKKTMEYRADGKMQKQLINEPFYGSNNQWRIKPPQSETDEAIRKRVADCVHFYYTLLTDKMAKENKSVAVFVGLPQVLNIYDGMITVVGKEKLSDKWINCFYNKEQAIKGQQMLENVITRKYSWNKKERNWLKKDAPVLREIYLNLQPAK